MQCYLEHSLAMCLVPMCTVIEAHKNVKGESRKLLNTELESSAYNVLWNTVLQCALCVAFAEMSCPGLRGGSCTSSERFISSSHLSHSSSKRRQSISYENTVPLSAGECPVVNWNPIVSAVSRPFLLTGRLYSCFIHHPFQSPSS